MVVAGQPNNRTIKTYRRIIKQMLPHSKPSEKSQAFLEQAYVRSCPLCREGQCQVSQQGQKAKGSGHSTKERLHTENFRQTADNERNRARKKFAQLTKHIRERRN